ncbi:MAG: glycosyltransferase [Cyclobacteriaceae bacterium]
MVLFEIIVWVCCFYLLFPLSTSLLASVLPENLPPVIGKEEPTDFACVITVYKELEISWPLVRALLNQKYADFHIYLVADGISDLMEAIQDPKLTIIQPKTLLKSKVASLHMALERMGPSHTHVLVLDPDNLVPDHFLSVLNKYHACGFKAVQGKRIAKNIDGNYAALDALGEYYYDFAVRYVPYMLGSSSTIAGSGMSIEKGIYKRNIKMEMQELSKKGVVVAEDKSLQLDLVRSGFRIAYAGAAIIFDEKITSSEQIGKQRGRWLNSYFGHIVKGLLTLVRGLIRLDWNQVFFSLVVLMPPMVVLVGISLLAGILAFWIKVPLFFVLMACLTIFVLGFGGILFLNRTPGKVMAAIPKIPLFVWGQLSGFMNIRRANKDFMATMHQEVLEIDAVWRNRRDEFNRFSHWWEEMPEK